MAHSTYEITTISFSLSLSLSLSLTVYPLNWVFHNSMLFCLTRFFICPSSMRCRDSNQRPSEYESPPIIARRGLPPCITRCYFHYYNVSSKAPNKRKLHLVILLTYVNQFISNRIMICQGQSVSY